MEYTILKSIKLDSSHISTANTQHFQGDEEINNIFELKIVQYDDSSECYLLYFDELGNELTDTLHDTLQSALKQAEFEFNVKSDEWE